MDAMRRAQTELCIGRSCKAWADLPAYAKKRYRQIDDLFPECRVFACGSRVRGDYVNERDGLERRALRGRAGKKAREVSDYDFWVSPDCEPIGPLPPWADRLPVQLPNSILVPRTLCSSLPDGVDGA